MNREALRLSAQRRGGRMELTFGNPGVDQMIREIMAFQTEGEADFWSAPLYAFYPQIDKEYAEKLPFKNKKNYLNEMLRKEYASAEGAINEKVILYSKHWNACKEQITAALSDAFAVDCTGLFPDLRCNVSMNPVQPRSLTEKSFDIFYLNSEKGAIGTAIHELIHFVWFYVWNGLFHDSYEEYERPSLKWLLSEMVVEAVMGDKRLSTINPYYPREQGGCIYPCFFDLKTGGTLLLDTLDEMYRNRSIDDFMKDSYAYCREHEQEIREHVGRELLAT